MAELLIRVVDKATSADPVFDALISKRDDVVSIQPDGGPWSAPERSLTDLVKGGMTLAAAIQLIGTTRLINGKQVEVHPWLIVKVPGVSATLLANFIEKDEGDPAQNFVKRRRAVGFNVMQWAAQGAPDITSVAQAQALIVNRPRVRDPNVLG